MSITIHKGSILDADTDAIVNPANSFLRHGGGLASIIDKAAQGVNYGCQNTWSLRNYLPSNPADTEGNAKRAAEFVSVADYIEANQAAPLIPTGGCHVTPAGRLPFKGIIHAVGPIYGDGSYMETDLMERVAESIFDTAQARGWSVAVPAISCGIFGFPVDDAARILVSVADWCEFPIQFWLFEDAHVEAFRKQAEELGVPLFGAA